MEIQFPTNATSATTIATPVAARLAAALSWSVNDILVAKVVGKTPENFTELAIGKRIVVARTDAPLEVGQKLNLKVTSTGDTTVMKVIGHEPAAAANTLGRALARVLPQQATVEDTERLMKSIDILGQDVRGLGAALGRSTAATLASDVQNLRNSLPSAEQLQNAPQLRSAVEQAALPTEARLRASVQEGGTPDVSGDVRAQFARLAADIATLPAAARGALDKLVHETLHAQAVARHDTALPAVQDLDSAPPSNAGAEHRATDIKSLVESVVARLESNQLQHAGQSMGQATPLLIDLPVARGPHTDLLHMEVESDGHQNDTDAPARTSVTLNLKLDGGHEFSARLQLAGDTLSLRLGSTDAEFNDEIAERIGDLQRDLADAGLEVNQIFIAPVAVSARPRIGARQLINEKV
jgi:hypothetical protein